MELLLAIVSCDIIAHSGTEDRRLQVYQLEEINRLVGASIDRHGERNVIWASRGDGGHIAFNVDVLPEGPLELICRLWHWAKGSLVPLRIMAHYGPLALLEGADGRTEFAGEAINFVGRAIRELGPNGVVVSKAFMEAINACEIQGIRFHDPILASPEYLTAQPLYLMSIENEFRSSWAAPAYSDRQKLQQAVNEGSAWEVVYYAKRLLQSDESDTDARQALATLGQPLLSYKDRYTGEQMLNPILARLDGPARVELVRAGELMERRYGELICDAGDEGDTMLVILRGTVGIVLPSAIQNQEGKDPEPTFVLRAGEIVGELAPRLRRRRTARVQCLSETSLLALSPDRLESLLEGTFAGASVLDEIRSFTTGRIVRYLCETLDFLVGPKGMGPLKDVPVPWEYLARRTRMVRYKVGSKPVVDLGSEEFGPPGIYLLTAGTLVCNLNTDKILDGENLPVLYVNIPGYLVSSGMQYRVREDADIIVLGEEGFKLLGGVPGLYGSIVDALERVLTPQFYYDVFIAYSFEDREIAQRWRDGLSEAGISVFMDNAESPGRFVNRLEYALRDSLVLLALISSHTLERPLEHNWTLREIEFRCKCFDADQANIIPVQLLGGDPVPFGDGFVPIDARRSEEEAITKAIKWIKSIRSSERPPPKATSRKLNIFL